MGVATGEFVSFSRPSIGRGEIDELLAVLDSGWLTTGPRVRRFEAAFAEWVGAPHAIALSSCTGALHLALLASGVGPGDEVITTPLTFCATANAIEHVGATPVFADIDPETMNLDPSAVEAVLTPSTKAVIPVHYGGRTADVAAFERLAGRRGLALVEDAAHAVEAVSNAGRVGTTARFTCFSFYATKNLMTGEGGMLTTASDEDAAWIRTAALHGMTRDGWDRYARHGTPHYDVVMPGFKYNMMDLQAALGLHQLARIHEMHARRTAIWARYDQAFADLPIARPSGPGPGEVHGRHLYAVLVDEARCGRSRDEVQQALQDAGVGTSIHFRALHLTSYYANRYALRRGMFPHAEAAADTTLSLPLSAALTDREVDAVVAAVRSVLAG
jgi:dTDP-4-amino-4,6-dideoxygalactose transaminase